MRIVGSGRHGRVWEAAGRVGIADGARGSGCARGWVNIWAGWGAGAAYRLRRNFKLQVEEPGSSDLTSTTLKGASMMFLSDLPMGPVGGRSGTAAHEPCSKALANTGQPVADQAVQLAGGSMGALHVSCQ